MNDRIVTVMMSVAATCGWVHLALPELTVIKELEVRRLVVR
jgi:hypothetical protein